ncbi:TolC family protein [bacterium]|nr:TolC family protein [bacterium]MBU1995428.1 TolC family protein [bacterium]
MILRYSLIAVAVLGIHAKDVYTVDNLAMQALQNSPDIKISASNYEGSKFRYDEASSGYLPKIDLHLVVGETGMSDISGNQDKMLNDNVVLGNLSMKQLLYDFGKTASRSDSLKYDSQNYAWQYAQKISDKKRDVKSAYYDVLKTLALIKVNKEGVALNEAQLYRSQKYFEAGIRTKIDVSDAKVRLIKSQLDLKKSEYNLQLSYAHLDKIIGFIESENEYEVYSQTLDLNNLYATLKDYELSLKDAISFAYENKSELKSLTNTLYSANERAKAASSEYYPQIYFDADYTKQSVDTFKASVPENKWQTLVNLDVNIYQGGLTSAKNEQARVDADISSSQLQLLKLSIQKETTQAFINVSKMKDSVLLSQNLLEVSQEKFEQAGKRYENGLSDYIELQEARQGYIDAMASLVINYYDYYNAVAILDNAIGK